MHPVHPRFNAFIHALDRLVAAQHDEPALLNAGEALLRDLVATDDWLPSIYRACDPSKYLSYSLYTDPQSRFSVQSFVWGPGRGTAVHNHTVWGLVGVLEGAERCREWSLEGNAPRCTFEHVLSRGEVDRVSPTIGDVHEVHNALLDGPSISVHVYGGDIGRIERSFFDRETGARSAFTSGYRNPTPWMSAL